MRIWCNKSNFSPVKYMRIYLLPFFLIWSLMWVDDITAQCASAPKVVRIQVDACGLSEQGNEFFQFITASAFNLTTTPLAISVDAISRGSFQAVPQAFIDGLNAKTLPCASALFVNPYAAPYNGIIPPGSVVLAFIDLNPVAADALRVNLRSLCGKAPIFVIRGAGAANSTAMFLNRSGCAFSCPRNINVTFGSCNRTYSFDANLLDGVTGAFLAVDDNGNVTYEPSDGCTPVSLDCEKPAFITPNLSPLTCRAVGHELPEISDIVTGNASYFTEPNRQGTAYTIGTILYDSILLYANDFNSCSPATTQIEKQYLVRISPGPVLAASMDRTEEACSYFILPAMEGTRLTGNQKYWTMPGGRGTGYKVGDTIRSAQILYPYDINFGCPTEAIFEIKFRVSPNITNVKDTIVPCSAQYTLPVITGAGLSPSRAFYTATQKGSSSLPPGTPILTSGRYFAYDEFSEFENCFDEDTFNVVITPRPIIPRDTFRNDTFCTSYNLPLYRYPLTYNTRLNGTGLPFSPGANIIADSKLYVTVSFPGCTVQDSVVLKKQLLFINPTILPSICDPILDSLPRITGNFLTGFEAFYSERGGRGKKYLPGDSVHAFKRNYLYDSKLLYIYDSTQYSTGKCVHEIPFIIPFILIVESDPIPDTTIDCDQQFRVPIIEPASFFNKAVYTLANRQGIKYNVGDVLPLAGTYYTYSDFALCHDEDTFRLSVRQGPQFVKSPDLIGCERVTLPKIEGTDFNADSTFYFELSNGNGTRYRPGQIVTRSGTYFITDISSPCTEDTLQLTVNTMPTLPQERTFSGCDSIRLPTFAAFPDLKFYNAIGNSSAPLPSAAWISRDTQLVMRNGDTSCFVQDFVSISLIKSPVLIPMPDTTVCNEFLLPLIRGAFLTTSEHYHSLSLDNGDTWYGNGRDYITSSMTLFVWDGDRNRCWDEDTFNITILPRPLIDSIAPVTMCKSFTLPTPTGTNLTSTLFYDRQNGQGRSFAPGTAINQSVRLYVYQGSPTCPAEQTLNITIRDSITSNFRFSDSILCVNQPLSLNHIGLRNDSTRYLWTWDRTGMGPFSDQANQAVRLDTGSYRVTLQATTNQGCIGPATSQSFTVVPQLAPLQNLTCAEGPDNIVFNWDQTPGASEYIIDLLQGPTGVRSPSAMIFSNLTLGQQVGIRVTPMGKITCANGVSVTLTCRTKVCDPITVQITDEAPFCSGDQPRSLVVFTIGLNPLDTVGLTRVWSGPGLINGVFDPSVAGPGNHIIRYTLTKDSCIYSDTTVIRVGSGSVIILNDKAIECAPPSQNQFQIRMQITTPNAPFTVHYSYAGGVSSVFQSSSPNFTLSASFGLIGDSIRIDSILDATGCKMQITSNAGTRTFRAVRFIAAATPQTVCDFANKVYQYRVRLFNSNRNDPYTILSGGGTIKDSFYISPMIAFNTNHRSTISHLYGCDTLVFNVIDPCLACIPVRDTFRQTLCENQTITIRGKSYNINRSTGMDTIPPAVLGQCDTIRFISIQFIRDRVLFVRSSICPDDFISFGNTIFDRTRTSGIVRLPGGASTGCDSVINVQLDVLSPVVRTIRDTICAGDSVILGGMVFNQNHVRDSLVFVNLASNGCDSIIYFLVSVQTLRVDILTESSGCTVSLGKSVVIRNVTGGSSPYTYALNNSPVVVIQSFPIRINNLPSDTFNVVLRSSAGCVVSTQVRFSPFASGLRVNLGPDRTIKLGDAIPIAITSNFNIASYRWITQSNLSCINCVNPFASPTLSSLYILEATDVNGCMVRDSLRILVDPDINVYVPNVFKTVGASDVNLQLHIFPAPQVIGIDRFSIFDRMGTTIIELQAIPIAAGGIPVWDGRFKGQDCPPAVYVYKILYTTSDGSIRTKYGDITLVY